MNWLDIVLIVFFVLSALMGLWRGLIMMLVPFIGLIIGVYVAGQHYGTVGGWLPIDNPEYAGWAAYAIIVVLFLIVFFVLAIFLKRIIHLSFLGLVDRIGGAVVGLALGALLCAAALAACAHFNLGTGFIQGSGVAQLLLDWLPGVMVLLPGEFDIVSDFFD